MFFENHSISFQRVKFSQALLRMLYAAVTTIVIAMRLSSFMRENQYTRKLRRESFSEIGVFFFFEIRLESCERDQTLVISLYNTSK